MALKSGHQSNSALATRVSFNKSPVSSEFHSPCRRIFLKNRQHKKGKSLDTRVTFKRVENGHIYIYILCAVKLKTGPRFGGFKVKTGPSFKLKTGTSFYSTVFPKVYSVLGVCSKTQIVSLCAKIVFAQNCLDVKNEVFE